MPPLSIFIIALNEADRIGRTIEAAKALSDDIVVVDSGSTDGTQALVESLGADKYVHFRLEGAGAQAAQLEQLADDTADAGSSENTYVARVSAKSAATAGSRVELALDTSKLTLFDPATGRNLSLAQ